MPKSTAKHANSGTLNSALEALVYGLPGGLALSERLPIFNSTFGIVQTEMEGVSRESLRQWTAGNSDPSKDGQRKLSCAAKKAVMSKGLSAKLAEQAAKWLSRGSPPKKKASEATQKNQETTEAVASSSFQFEPADPAPAQPRVDTPGWMAPLLTGFDFGELPFPCPIHSLIKPFSFNALRWWELFPELPTREELAEDDRTCQCGSSTLCTPNSRRAHAPLEIEDWREGQEWWEDDGQTLIEHGPRGSCSPYSRGEQSGQEFFSRAWREWYKRVQGSIDNHVVKALENGQHVDYSPPKIVIDTLRKQLPFEQVLSHAYPGTLVNLGSPLFALGFLNSFFERFLEAKYAGRISTAMDSADLWSRLITLQEDVTA